VDTLHWLRGLLASLAMVACVLSQWWLTGQIAMLRSMGAEEYPTPLYRIARLADYLAPRPVLALVLVCAGAVMAVAVGRSTKSRLGRALAWLGVGALVAAAVWYGLGLMGPMLVLNPGPPGCLSS